MGKDRLGDELSRASGKAKQWTGRATGNATLQRRGRFQAGLAKVRITARSMTKKLLARLRERSGR